VVPQAFISSHSNTLVPLPDLSSLRQSIAIATMRPWHVQAMCGVDQVFQVTQKSFFRCKWTTFSHMLTLYWKISSKGWSGFSHWKLLFSHWKWWFSIVFCMLSYSSHSCPISIASCSPLRPVVTVWDSAVTCVAHPPPTWSPEGARSPQKNGLRWPNCALICGFDFKSSPHSCNKNS